jgi:D-3-phosphoglycerate dehydrogenase
MIVLLETVHADAEAILREVDDVMLAPSPTRLPDVPLDEITALVTRGLGQIPRELIESLPSLRVVARCGAGLDNIDTQFALANGSEVVYAPGVTAAAVAEHAMMLALCLARQTVRITQATARGDWGVRDGFVSAELRGRRLGVIGLGSIGSRVAELASAFGMEVVGWSRRRRDHTPVRQVDLDELITGSDVIQLCIALGPETAGMIDATRLASMRRGALLVNTARGQLVELDALEAALDTGQLGGYATDVWNPEPPPADAALLRHPRVLVTPHVAAFTDRTYRDMCVGPAEAIAAILRGNPPDPRFVLAR